MNSELLILLVEKHPCLWNYNDQYYYKKDKKDEAWYEILEEMNPESHMLDSIDKIRECASIKKRWTHIRDYFKKNLKRIKKNPKGSKDRQYIYADMLAFVRPMIERKDSEGYSSDDASSELELKSESMDPLEFQQSALKRKKSPTITKTRKSLRSSDYNLENSEKKSIKIHKKSHSSDEEEQKDDDYVHCDDDDENKEEHENTHEIETKEKEKEKEKDHEVKFTNYLQNLQNMGAKTTQEEDDQRFLLSFRSDMSKMNEDDKIEFKIEMLHLLKTFKNKISKFSSTTTSTS